MKRVARTSAAVGVILLAAGFSAAQEQKSIPQEVQQYLESWVGEWTIEGTWGNTPVQGRSSVRLSRGKNAMISDWSTRIGDQQIHGALVEGWDSSTGWTTEQGAVSDGEIYAVRWSKKGENLWEGQAQGSVAGQKTSSRQYLEKTATGFVFRITENKRGDEVLPNWEVKFTRATKKAQGKGKK